MDRKPFNISRFFLLVCLLLLALPAGACAFRPDGSTPDSDFSVSEKTPLTDSAEPTPVPTVNISYYADDLLLYSEQLPAGELPTGAPEPEDLRIIGWSWEGGESTVPGTVPVWTDTVFQAVTRPRIQSGGALFTLDAHGCFRPEDPLTQGEAAAALRALLADPADMAEELARLEGSPDDPVLPDAFQALLTSLFAPDAAEAAVRETLSEDAASVSRAQAAWCFARLLDRAGGEAAYYPDVSPSHWASPEILAVTGPGTVAASDILAQAKDGYVWLDGYLYCLDENGWFYEDATVDCLYYDGNGRYTCGNTELDDFVAETLVKLTSPGNTRREDLKAVYNHVKNDFSYLPRNYYASGATGWDIDEALTLFRTGKGNCYCYAGTFCALARGLGYNAVTYSGTMGNQDQPHAWTEISLDGGIYICDPEIEWNYWYLQMYTDNFMMPRENAGGWNYQAVGRT